MHWAVTIYSLQSLFTANLHASWVSACWIKITVKFLWQQHEMPRVQFYSRLWQERHDWLCVQPWRERLVCSIIGCDTAWKRLHSVNSLFCHAFQQVNWVVFPVSLVYGQWVFFLKGIICQTGTFGVCCSSSVLQHFADHNAFYTVWMRFSYCLLPLVSILLRTVWKSISRLLKRVSIRSSTNANFHLRRTGTQHKHGLNWPCAHAVSWCKC